MLESTNEPTSWIDQPVLGSRRLNWELLILSIILILALFSRFYILGERVMSHDETIHVYHNSWSLFTGQGYKHDPLSHGPFQTHVIALSYFLFGDSDFSARIPAALFSIATVGMVWFYRRYLGRAGTIVAMVMMLISPYLLYYGRYARNEAFAAFAGVLTLWAILRYLETGKAKYTYWLTLGVVLHFTAKETAFIYSAQAIIFLALFFMIRIWQARWQNPGQRQFFFPTAIAGAALVSISVLTARVGRNSELLNPGQTAAPAVPGGTSLENLPVFLTSPLIIGLMIGGVLLLAAAVYFMIKGITWKKLRRERSFSLLILCSTFFIPQLSAFPIYLLGWNVPTNAGQVEALSQNMTDISRIAMFLVPMVLASMAIGLAWNWKVWSINALIFYGIYILLYTSVFTNGPGLFTGLVGSLGYWLKQQNVQRGSQPWFYYVFVQIPIYEYVPALASLLGFGLLIFGKRPLLRFSQAFQEWYAQKISTAAIEAAHAEEAEIEAGITGEIAPHEVSEDDPYQLEGPPVLALLAFWSVISIIAFSIAGEKMPWLTAHMAWPLILFGGWAIGYMIDTTDWGFIRRRSGVLVILALAVFLMSAGTVIGSLAGPDIPFGGKTLAQLQTTNSFIVSLFVSLASLGLLLYLVRGWYINQLLRLLLLVIFAGLGLLTLRTSIQSNFIAFDQANELLVYAHSARGVKEVMEQVDAISRRTSDGNALVVAHDGEYPFWWYLRRYPNARYYGNAPSRSLRDVPVIIVGSSNFGKIEPVVGQAYDRFDYIRLWWPNQDYFSLKNLFTQALSDARMRQALYQIWLNRDYTLYGQVTQRDMSLEKWQPSDAMRLYIRKDLAAQMWEYGSAPAAEQVIADPYEGKQIDLTADQVIGSVGSEAGQFQRPRDLAIAPDGTLYVADTDNHRIQHLAADGRVLHVWGTFADVMTGQAPGGTFNQPWGIGVGLNGSVYVADTWNHRVQQFTAEGEFIRMWGIFGQGESPEAFWGPRDIAVDVSGRVFVTDTGNKRVVIFDQDGKFISQFGSAGLGSGEFDEPVGITVGEDGRIYVADTWNQRIQVFQESEDGLFQPVNAWEVAAWYGQSLDNKPYLVVDPTGRLFAVDPEGYRVLQYTDKGEFVNYWGAFGAALNQFGMTASVAVDQSNGIWVSDAGNSRLMHFTLP